MSAPRILDMVRDDQRACLFPPQVPLTADGLAAIITRADAARAAAGQGKPAAAEPITLPPASPSEAPSSLPPPVVDVEGCSEKTGTGLAPAPPPRDDPLAVAKLRRTYQRLGSELEAARRAAHPGRGRGDRPRPGEGAGRGRGDRALARSHGSGQGSPRVARRRHRPARPTRASGWRR